MMFLRANIESAVPLLGMNLYCSYGLVVLNYTTFKKCKKVTNIFVLSITLISKELFITFFLKLKLTAANKAIAE